MYFRILNDEASGALTYLLSDTSAREAVLVDPMAQDLTVLSALMQERELRLRWILRTHHHDGINPGELAALQGMQIPIVQGDRAPGVNVPREGDLLPFGDEFVRVLETPGHTRHCLSFVWRDRVFCGDLLCANGCQKQRQPSAPQALWDNVASKVFTLPDETLLFFGHTEQGRMVSTVMEQRLAHPFFASLTRDEFLTRMVAPAGHNRVETVIEE